MPEHDANQNRDEPDTEGTAPHERDAADVERSPDQPDVRPGDEDPRETDTPPDEEFDVVSDRALTADEESTSEPEQNVPTAEPTGPSYASVLDDTSDVASLPEEPVEDPKSPESQRPAGDWQAEMSAHRIAVELKRVETRVRELLSERDSRRKRKLAGTFRWHELEEDILAWRAEQRFDRTTLDELHRLVCRRHYLFNQLRFAASTRPTWNS